MRKLPGLLVLSLLFACEGPSGPADTTASSLGTTSVSTTTVTSEASTGGGPGGSTGGGSTGGVTEGVSGSSGGESTGTTGASATSTSATGSTSATTAGESTSTTGGDGVVPPLGGSSGGQGGGPAAGDVMQAGGVEYRLITPDGAGPHPLMIVYSGVEGGQTMTSNLLMVAGFTGTDSFLFAVLDGKQYNGDGTAGATVLDDVRAKYDVDNDRTYLLSESAGTTAGLQLGLSLRQSYFAAYWANDVNASASPALDAGALGFQPWGNAGPGGQFAQANAIVDGMTAAGYRVEEPAPYDGPGADQHGNTTQFLAALQWFPGRSRQ